MASDVGETLKAKVFGDSTAAKGIGSRSGVGKVRHLHLPLLWIQDFVRKKLITLIKKKGSELSADLGTKHVPRLTLLKHLANIGFSYKEGQATSSLRAAL